MALPVLANSHTLVSYEPEARKYVNAVRSSGGGSISGILEPPQISGPINHPPKSNTPGMNKQPRPMYRNTSFLGYSGAHKPFNFGPYPSIWLLQGKNGMDGVFERAWTAYKTAYNGEFKAGTGSEGAREHVMAGHIHGEDILLPRPAIEHRLTRRRQKNVNCG